jgi:serine protease Do
MVKSAMYKCLVAATLLCLSSAGFAQSVDAQMEPYFRSIYQIIVIETDTNNKAALGSGFQVTEDGYVITNFHVVSGMIFEPEHHRVEYLDSQGRTGTLELVDFDAVSDVALLKANDVEQDYLVLQPVAPEKGTRVFAIGNPNDYGMLVVDGAYNGLAEKSYIDRILYSGSLNSGMSGGPALNREGEVVGVNVATAGSQLSFLVPAEKAVALLKGRENPISAENYMGRLSQQILSFQRNYYQNILSMNWSRENLRDVAGVLGEFSSDISCWGRSNEEDSDAEHLQLILSCYNANNIFLKSRFNTGQMHYSFYYYNAREMSSRRFYDMLSGHGYQPDNRAGRSDVTNYECEQSYLDDANGVSDSSYRQVGLCFRAYRDMDGVYDALFYLFQGRGDEALVSHFTLAGVDRQSALDFTAKFMEQAQWKSL